MKKIEDKYKKLTDIEHILLRPGMYISSTKANIINKWTLEDGKMIRKELAVINGLLKLFDEIIMNSIDESKREMSRLNSIEVEVKEDTITVRDNGGIAVVKHKDYDGWLPEMLFSETKAGSNFDEEENRTWSGMNGIGSVCVNIFSKKFIVSTCDGKNSFYQVFTENMRNRTEPLIKKNKKNHTEISFTPDYDRFGLSKLDDVHFNLIKKRVIDLAACNQSINFTFNDEKINFKTFDDYVKLYTPVFFSDTNKDKSWHVSVALSESGFQQVSFVNSTETYDGGTHVEYIMSQIITEMRAFFLRKHKTDVKPSELRNHMFLFLNSTVINPSFSSQTKEKLITEQKEFADALEISAKLVNAILKSDIVHSILDWIQQKKAADENKAARQRNKSLDKIKVDKLIDAKSKDRKICECFIFEGDSASVSFRKYRNAQTQGAFTLRGKFMNVAETTTQKLVDNNEVVNLMASLGLKLGQKVKSSDIRYGKIYLAVDADYDGNSIAGLLINFIFKFWPELFEMKMVYKLETPIVIARNKKTNKKLPFFSQTEYNNWLDKASAKDWEIKYKKGLSALVDDEYQDMVQTPKLTLITKDDFSHSSLQTWFGKDSEPRKVEILK